MSDATPSPTRPKRLWILPRRFRLRMLLLYVNLIVLVLPVTGFLVLRIYENELIRRTEGELLAQGAFIRASYLRALDAHSAASKPKVSYKDRRIGHAPAPEFADRFRSDRMFEHIPSTIDLNSVKLRQTAPSPKQTSQRAHSVAVLAGSEVSELMQNAQRVTLAGMRIVDHQGIVVGSSREEFGMSLMHRDEVRRALRGEYVKLVRKRHSSGPKPSLNSISRRSSVRLFIAMPIAAEGKILGAVIVSRTPLSLTRALYDNRFALITLTIVQLLAVLFLSLYTSATIVRPVHKLIEQARELERGAPAPEPLAHPVTHEVELLSTAIVEMARSLHERADYIKTFASNVSHEFKTPLTSIRGTVELLEDHLDEMDHEERERFLEIIDTNAERLQRLVNRLLDLARADVLNPGDQTTHVAEAIEAVSARYAMSALNLNLDISDDAREVDARIARVTFDSIIANLIDNARQHVGEDVELTMRVTRDDEMLQIDVSDNGPGVSEANRKRIFDQFFTTARDSGGTGLGLSVVRSLLLAHEGSIELLDGLPTTFRITLPAHASEPAQEKVSKKERAGV